MYLSKFLLHEHDQGGVEEAVKLALTFTFQKFLKHDPGHCQNPDCMNMTSSREGGRGSRREIDCQLGRWATSREIQDEGDDDDHNVDLVRVPFISKVRIALKIIDNFQSIFKICPIFCSLGKTYGPGFLHNALQSPSSKNLKKFGLSFLH